MESDNFIEYHLQFSNYDEGIASHNRICSFSKTDNAFIFLLFNLADAGKYYVSVFKDNYEQCQSC